MGIYEDVPISRSYVLKMNMMTHRGDVGHFNASRNDIMNPTLLKKVFV